MEKEIKVPVGVVEALLNNPGNRDVLNQLREIAENQAWGNLECTE